MTESAGLIVDRDGLFFVPASVARKIVRKRVVSHIPGTQLGMALVSGRVVSVLSISERETDLLLCEVAGEDIAVAGLEVVASGTWPRIDGGIEYDGGRVRELDLATVLAVHRPSTLPPPRSESP